MPAPITHRQPALCPVCSDSLITLRLGCPTCGTEVTGHFDTCRYCRLDATDLAILEVFLRGRGNVRDVQAHLGVSYPTARARLGEVLDRLGLGAESHPGDPASATGPGDDPAEHAAAHAAEPSATQRATQGAAQRAGQVARLLDELAAGRIDVTQAEAAIRDLGR